MYSTRKNIYRKTRDKESAQNENTLVRKMSKYVINSLQKGSMAISRSGRVRSALKILASKLTRKRSLGWHRRRWEDNIRMMFKKCVSVINQVDSIPNRDYWIFIVYTALNRPVSLYKPWSRFILEMLKCVRDKSEIPIPSFSTPCLIGSDLGFK